MGERTYNSSVLLHNWFEEIALDQDVLKDFINRKERGELLMQKLGSFKDDLLNKTELAKNADGHIHFGDQVLLINPGSDQNHPSDPLRAPMALTMNIDQSRFMTSKQVDSPCDVCGSANITPCVRNTFIITSVDGSCKGDPLRYGQNFTLRTLEGVTGQANIKVLINHARTNQALAVFQKHSFWTMFGREHEITTHTFFDPHRAEEDLNHWIIVTGDPGVPHGTLFQRPPPICEDPEPKKEPSQEYPDCINQK
ncbi:cilia- and flagella-associated protein 161 isoform X3 [Amblyraja radiata]|uniref:cilia- and flagella-associated protein 161 isoform X3 n=1 Tax=Amblyraja radiata TaxID=386614 RepID=UPI001403E862|nr:cilia- and flagella-associated protein 161 isoform X3 [Amblyraja radiata]